MSTYDFAIAFTWEYDYDFVDAIEEILQAEQLSTYHVSDYNIKEVTDAVRLKKLSFRTYLDRASDVDDDYLELAKILTKRKVKIFNPYDKVHHAIDKASMHMEFITAGLNVPYSIIIPPHKHNNDLKISVEDLAVLGRPFIIKPCNTTGGGIGVVTGAESLKEVLEERSTFESDKYILQQKIYPKMIDNKRAWFRCFWAFGKPICCWWDDQTHIYETITEEEFEKFHLKKLNEITRKIAKLTELDFFSTEVAITDENKFIVIDYVNDQCDMRFKSKHTDGIPDNVIYEIIEQLKKAVMKEVSRK
uniref:ATP-grasp domain-containing protein n=1 Tax=Ignavibacterium album TaxID=591197 RepID=A0A7V2ZJ30_9BACT